MTDLPGRNQDPTRALFTGHQARGTTGWVNVLGSSMRPLLEAGDEILVSLGSPEEIREGDLAVFGEFGRLTAHRIVKRVPSPQGTMFLEKGDGNLWAGVIAPERLRGRVNAVRKKGKLLDFQEPRWQRWNRWAARAGYGYLRVSGFIFKGLREKRKLGEVFGPFRGYSLFMGVLLSLPLWWHREGSSEKRSRQPKG
jgi:hypothetical protein